MPYGCLDSENLSQASRTCLDKASDWWQKSMHTSKHKTFLVLAGYDDDGGAEIRLRRTILLPAVRDPDLLANIIELSAVNEAGLAQKIAHVRELLPVETITVFSESRNAVSVKAIFKRKFGRTLQIKKFRAEFEFDHQWVSTSTAFAWFSRNWLLRVWFEIKQKLGRGVRKKIRYLFRS